MKKKKIIIAGGTGFIGSHLIQYFKKQNYDIVILTRGADKTHEGVRYVHWDGKTLGGWQSHIDGADVVINLTGKSVDCRYTEENKRMILSSRVDATTVVGQAIAAAQQPPTLWFNSSTATIYKGSRTQRMTESQGVIGDDFSMSVAKAWEKALNDAPTPHTRKIALRISLVLGKDGGVLPVLTRLCKFGLGGRQGDGTQKFAWIHQDDVVRIIQFCIDHEDIAGPINCAAPDDITNREFMAALRKSIGMPFGLPSPRWMIVLGAVFLRTEPELILKSRYVYPERLLDAGFVFEYGEIEGVF